MKRARAKSAPPAAVVVVIAAVAAVVATVVAAVVAVIAIADKSDQPFSTTVPKGTVVFFLWDELARIQYFVGIQRPLDELMQVPRLR